MTVKPKLNSNTFFKSSTSAKVNDSVLKHIPLPDLKPSSIIHRAKPIGVNNSSILSGTILMNPCLYSDHLYHWECSKVNEGNALDLKLYWVVGNPVLGLGLGEGTVLVQIVK